VSKGFIQLDETLLIRPSLIVETASEGAKRAGREFCQRRGGILHDGGKVQLVKLVSRVPAIE
jgi:hypothetical protein